MENSVTKITFPLDKRKNFKLIIDLDQKNELFQGVGILYRNYLLHTFYYQCKTNKFLFSQSNYILIEVVEE